MATYVHDTEFFTARTLAFAAIVALHVFILWAFATGLARKAIEVLAPPIQTDILQEEKTKTEPPPPPPPELRKEVVEVPPPDINIAMPEVGPSTSAITARVEQPKAAPVARAAVAATAIKLGKGFPNVDDYYPDASRRLGEEGLTVVAICVGPDGKLTEPPKMKTSSNHERLDQAAVKVATLGSGRFIPATEEGKPITKCTDLPVRFKLHN